jgi:hypothetical protein
VRSYEVEQQGGTRASVTGNTDFRQPCPHDLGRVDVDADQLAGNFEEAVLIHVIVGRPEFGADRQHHIRGLDQLARSLEKLADIETPSGWLGRQDATAVGGHRHRRIELLQRVRADFLPLAHFAPPPDEDHRRLGRIQQGLLPRQSLQLLPFEGTGRATRDGVFRHAADDPAVRQHDIDRQFDVNRARAGAVEHGERAGQRRRKFFGTVDRVAEGRDLC